MNARGLIFADNEAALIYRRHVIISDTHIGIEREFMDSGINVKDMTEDMLERVSRVIETINAKHVVILGDLKHTLPGRAGYDRNAKRFIERLSDVVDVIVVKGNHDWNIEKMFEGVDIKKPQGFRIGDVYLFHGHTWPSKEFIDCKYVVMGHIHPQIEIRNRLSHSFVQDVWIVANLEKDVAKRYGFDKETVPKLIIMPKFNRLAGGAVLNRGGLDVRSIKEDGKQAPLLKYTDKENMRVYLLNGSYIGTLADLEGYEV